MTYADLHPFVSYRAGGELDKSNFCRVTFQCRQPSSILAGSSDSLELLTTESVLSPPNDHLDDYRTTHPYERLSNGTARKATLDSDHSVVTD
jgi:hypothetical protein